MGDSFSSTNHLYISKRTIFSRSSTGIEGIDYCRKGTKRVSTRGFYFSYDIDFYGTDIGNGNACIYLSITAFRSGDTCIYLTQSGIDTCFSFYKVEASYMYLSSHRENDITLIIYLLGSATFGSAPYLYQEFVSCIDDVTLRGGYIDRWGKGDFRILEKIVAKNPTFFHNHGRISFLSCAAKYFLLRGNWLATWGSCFSFGSSGKGHDTLSELSNLRDRYAFYTGSSFQVSNGVALCLCFFPEGLNLFVRELIYIDIGKLL